MPYALLAPGMLWLLIFFFVPMLTLFQTSLQEGSLEQGYVLTWRFANYTDALSAFASQYLRSFLYAAAATVAALLLGTPPRSLTRVVRSKLRAAAGCVEGHQDS